MAKIDSLGTVINGLQERLDGIKPDPTADETSLESVRDMIDKIEGEMASLSEVMQRRDASDIQSHRESERLFAGIQSIKNTAGVTQSDSSKEMMALLRLSEYQSGIRMNAESKYGEIQDLKRMASQTVAISDLFERISESDDVSLPREVRQWAVGKIFECAEKWEVRFTDVYLILTAAIGKDMFKESVRIPQVRDIYGMRAVDEIKDDLGIS